MKTTTWTATMDCGWVWTVRARTEAEAVDKAMALERRWMGQIRTPVDVARRGR